MNEPAAWAMVETMAHMQDEHNQEVHPRWREQGHPYYRAVWVECAELLDHFGWKWWKHQQPDLDQVRLEVVDIWHFGMSELIRADAMERSIAQTLLEVDPHATPDPEAFRDAIEQLAMETLEQHQFVLEPFVAVLRTLPLGLTDLFRLYVGKNVLNSFRQANGYKDGGYQKIWHGREDNQHLMELLESIECAAEDVPAQLYAALGERYPA